MGVFFGCMGVVFACRDKAFSIDRREVHSPENSSENGADFFFFINIYASLFQWLIRDLNIEDWGMYLLLRKIKQR